MIPVRTTKGAATRVMTNRRVISSGAAMATTPISLDGSKIQAIGSSVLKCPLEYNPTPNAAAAATASSAARSGCSWATGAGSGAIAAAMTAATMNTSSMPTKGSDGFPENRRKHCGDCAFRTDNGRDNANLADTKSHVTQDKATKASYPNTHQPAELCAIHLRRHSCMNQEWSGDDHADHRDTGDS